jgi:hypothetical protein
MPETGQLLRELVGVDAEAAGVVRGPLPPDHQDVQRARGHQQAMAGRVTPTARDRNRVGGELIEATAVEDCGPLASYSGAGPAPARSATPSSPSARSRRRGGGLGRGGLLPARIRYHGRDPRRRDHLNTPEVQAAAALRATRTQREVPRWRAEDPQPVSPRSRPRPRRPRARGRAGRHGGRVRQHRRGPRPTRPRPEPRSPSPRPLPVERSRPPVGRR